MPPFETNDLCDLLKWGILLFLSSVSSSGEGIFNRHLGNPCSNRLALLVSQFLVKDP